MKTLEKIIKGVGFVMLVGGTVGATTIGLTSYFANNSYNQDSKMFAETKLEQSIRKEYEQGYQEILTVFGDEVKNSHPDIFAIENDIDKDGNTDVIIFSDYGVSYFKNYGENKGAGLLRVMPQDWLFSDQIKLVDFKPYNLGKGVICDLKDINKDGLTDIIAMSRDGQKILYFENQGAKK